MGDKGGNEEGRRYESPWETTRGQMRRGSGLNASAAQPRGRNRFGEMRSAGCRLRAVGRDGVMLLKWPGGGLMV